MCGVSREELHIKWRGLSNSFWGSSLTFGPHQTPSSHLWLQVATAAKPWYTTSTGTLNQMSVDSGFHTVVR